MSATSSKEIKMESITVLSPYKTRFIKESDSAELVNLFHIARTALSGTSYTKYDRMLWACKEFCKAHSNISQTAAYKDLDGILSF